jgi:hypothetical protein
MKNLLYLLTISLFFFACGGGAKTEEKADGGDTAEMQEKEGTDANKYTITPFNPSPSFEDAEIESMTYANGKFSFGIGGTSYQLGIQTPDAPQKMCANSDKGQHIHLIVDDQPYAAKYEADFDYDITDGEHYILAFLSRSYHESIKTDKAFVAQKVTIANKSITDGSIVESPMLFYSRPKGTYVGKKNTDLVMLDFYLTNATLGTDYTVKAEINGEEHLIDKWQPYYIEGLPMGDNTIKLTLLDKDGKPAAVPLNPVERTFTLKEDPAEKAKENG